MSTRQSVPRVAATNGQGAAFDPAYEAALGGDARTRILRFVDPRAVYGAPQPSPQFPTLAGLNGAGLFPSGLKQEPDEADVLDSLDPFSVSLNDNDMEDATFPGLDTYAVAGLGPAAAHERSSNASDNEDEDGSPYYAQSPPDHDPYYADRFRGVAPLSVSPSSLPMAIGGRTTYSASMPTALTGTTRTKPISFPPRASFASSVPSGSYGSVGDFEEAGSSVERGSGKKNDSASKRRRRESHNAVERRRRDTINMQIQELCDLLPLELVPSIGPGQAPGSRPNKGSVLRRGVDYIRMLQRDKVSLEQRCRDLEVQLLSLGIEPIPIKEENRDMGMGDVAGERLAAPAASASRSRR